ncbi:MAG: DUF3465 domain-containing protein [Cyanobacteria bacterium P01_A01_bin.116]
MRRRELFGSTVGGILAGLLPILTAPVIAAPSYLYRNSKAEVMGSKTLAEAFKNRQSDVIIDSVSGTVEAVLPDDTEGSRHQRFIIRISREQTILVVHNIDVALRLSGLRKGDRVSVKGEYEWNDRGGLIHWTHKDPRSAHEDGWIDYGNVRYE